MAYIYCACRPAWSFKDDLLDTFPFKTSLGLHVWYQFPILSSANTCVHVHERHCTANTPALKLGCLSQPFRAWEPLFFMKVSFSIWKSLRIQLDGWNYNCFSMHESKVIAVNVYWILSWQQASAGAIAWLLPMFDSLHRSVRFMCAFWSAKSPNLAYAWNCPNTWNLKAL